MGNGDDINNDDSDFDLAEMFKKIDSLKRIEFHFSDNSVGYLRGKDARKWVMSCLKLAAKAMEEK